MRTLLIGFSLAILAVGQHPTSGRPSAPKKTATHAKALVIGNSNYTSLDKLEPTSARDASAVADALRGLGFDVTLAVNVPDRKTFDSVIAEFAIGKLQAGDLAVFYFSGHGFSVGPEDYLAPTAFQKGSDTGTAQLTAEPITNVIDYFKMASLRILLLDACRENYSVLKGNGANGIWSLPDFVPPQASGSLVAYATSSGFPASPDSPAGLSFYTSYLIESFKTQPDIKTAIYTAKDLTVEASHRTQIPEIHDAVDWKLMPADIIHGTAKSGGSGSSETELVSQLLKDLCVRGVLTQPAEWEESTAVYASVLEIRQHAADLVNQLSATSKALRPAEEIQIAARDVLQNPAVFPQGAGTTMARIDQKAYAAICKFREAIAEARHQLEQDYSLANQCPERIGCPAWTDGQAMSIAPPETPKEFTEEMLNAALRKNVSPRGGITAPRWTLWLDLPPEYRQVVSHVTYKFPDTYRVSMGPYHPPDAPKSISVVSWEANGCSTQGTVTVEFKTGFELTSNFNLCLVPAENEAPNRHNSTTY
jgi:hypothetical protein